jgi:hypothetical protein
MSARETASDKMRQHGSDALIQVRQLIIFTENTAKYDYWLEVERILLKR